MHNPLQTWADAHISGCMHDAIAGKFPEFVRSLCAEFSVADVLEIGGGRSPIFGTDRLVQDGLQYHINDISMDELAAAPATIPLERRVCFDVADPALTVTGSYDFVYSRSVLEHVDGTLQAWSNSYALLRPGGIALHMFPTLFASPFVLNRMLPVRASSALLARFGRSQYKKFPALYHNCRSTRSVEQSVRDVGFEHVLFVPIWGHDYYDRVPLVRSVERYACERAAKADARWYSAYCLALAQR